MKENIYHFFLFCQQPDFKTKLMQRSELIGKELSQWRAAAVLVALVKNVQQWEILLTLRQPHLSAHAGEVAFAGGKIEPEDNGAVNAALREAVEEIGINRAKWQVIGELPLCRTPSGFEITPVIAYCDAFSPLDLNPNAEEVAEVFTVPLDFILTKENYTERVFSFRSQKLRVSSLAYLDYDIWGVTALILQHLQKCWEVYKK